MANRNDMSPESGKARLRSFPKHAPRGKTQVLTAKEMLSNMKTRKN